MQPRLKQHLVARTSNSLPRSNERLVIGSNFQILLEQFYVYKYIYHVPRFVLRRNLVQHTKFKTFS